jgi:hypothetical protein
MSSSSRNVPKREKCTEMVSEEKHANKAIPHRLPYARFRWWPLFPVGLGIGFLRHQKCWGWLGLIAHKVVEYSIFAKAVD